MSNTRSRSQPAVGEASLCLWFEGFLRICEQGQDLSRNESAESASCVCLWSLEVRRSGVECLKVGEATCHTFIPIEIARRFVRLP